MAIYDLPAETSLNFTEGADRIFVYVAQQVPIFIPLVLFALFMIVLLGGFFAQKRSEGKGDMPQWFAIAGYITTIAAMLMLLVDNLVNLTTVIITISVSLVGSIWLFFSKDK